MQPELVNAKERHIDWRGKFTWGVSAPTFEAALAEFNKNHPDQHPTECYQYGNVYYFPKEVKE